MHYKELISKALRISLIPSIQWKEIKNEKDTSKELMWNFAFPVILFSAIGRDIGLLFVAKSVLGYSFNLALLLIIFAAYLLNFTLPRLGIETDYLRILKLVVYTFTPLFIVTFFVYLHPLLRILIPIGIYIFIAYTLYVFWYGVQELFDITLEKKLRFIVITILVGFVIIFLAQHIYGLLLGWVMPGMEAYVK
jgi:hypothetical protein